MSGTLKTVPFAVLDAIPACVYWKGADLRFAGANRAFLEFSRSSSLEALRRKGSSPDILAEFDSQALATGRAVSREEYCIVLPEDQLKTISFSCVPIFRAAGKPDGVICMITDVTASAVLGNQLRQRKDFLARLVEALPVGFFAKDPSAGFTYRIWNKKMEEIFGYSAGDAVDSRDWNLFGTGSAEMLEAHDRELVAEPESCTNPKFYTLRGNNGLRTVSMVRVPLFDDLLDTTLVAGVVDDITREHQLEEQLRQSQKMEAVGRLAGGVAHDFNNLLQVIMGAAEIGLLEGGNHEKYLNQILKAGEKAMSLTRQLLSFSRDENFKREPFEVDHRIGEFIGLLHRIVEENVSLEFRPGAPGVLVNGDPFQLEQVLMNLIVNARDAIEGHGNITVETSVKSVVCVAGSEPVDSMVISVADTGTGIPEDIRNRIFEPFFTTKKQGKGTGLGLASSYAIVVKHQGTIQVESSPGLGTRFNVCIPVYSDNDILPSVHKQAFDADTKGKRLTILLAEDEKMVREIALTILESAGHSVLEAENGLRAVELYNIHREEIDIAVFDAMMPEMNGKDAFEEILGSDPDLPCLFCTGYSGRNLLQHFQGKARVAVLQKPYSNSELLSLTEAMAAKRKHVTQDEP